MCSDVAYHNAGVDAREPLASVPAMMFAYPGVHQPEANPFMPILVAVDLWVHDISPVTLCLHVPPVNEPMTQSDQVDAYQRLVSPSWTSTTPWSSQATSSVASNHITPWFKAGKTTILRLRMGIHPEFELKSRAWFIYGLNPWNTRSIQIRRRPEQELQYVEIAEATEINPVALLSDWVKGEIVARPSRGSFGFPINSQMRYCWSM